MALVTFNMQKLNQKLLCIQSVHMTKNTDQDLHLFPQRLASPLQRIGHIHGAHCIVLVCPFLLSKTLAHMKCFCLFICTLHERTSAMLQRLPQWECNLAFTAA